jgi:acetolactate synthase-1/2/3 large subunit
MKIKVSDYIVNFIEKNNLDTIFSITGGFAMHLNDSFGNNNFFNVYYQHHEQACGYSATGYSKTNSRPVVVCTTAGVAATNAISPCLVAYQDSLPILFISGQSKSIELTRVLVKENEKMNLRHYAGQDCDIIGMVKPITKYAYEITNIEEIPFVMETAIKNLINGRPGPVWISIPIDIQGYFMENIEIPLIAKDIINCIPPREDLDKINILLKESKRPLILAGNGIKLGNCIEKFTHFIEKHKIPVVVTLLSTDIIETDNQLYAGKVGLIGDRHGNFTLQNCDLLISFGCRMAQGVVGYRADAFAREAKIIYIDNDENEIEKNNVNYSLKVNMDLNLFFDYYDYDINNYEEWVNKCLHWKKKWSFELPINLNKDIINPYVALHTFFNIAPENKITMCASGSIVTNVWHMVKIKKGDKFLHSSQGDMGFELPASIGSQIAEPNKTIITIMGEGSFQLNIQELQTIVHHKLPIKILLMNNNSYGANVITQGLYFNNKYGSDNDSGVSFPKTENIANAYGIEYMSVRKNEDLEEIFNKFLNFKNTVICEVFVSIQQRTPKLSTVKNEDGTFQSRPFEDMEPFLSREEFEKEMIIKII